MLRWIILVLIVAGSRVMGAELSLRVTPRWNRATLKVPSEVYLAKDGAPVCVTRIAAIFSEAALIRRDGRVVRLDGQFGYIDAASGRRTWTLTGVPAGDYTGLEFAIGVPPEINHADSGQWPAGHALNPLTNRLSWSWQGGYVFLALEGKWAKTTKPAKVLERGFSYHLATDSRRMTVRFQALFTVREHTDIDLAFDVAKVLAVPELGRSEKDESTHSAANDTLAPQLASAVEHAWFWLGAKEDAQAADETEKPAAEAVRAGTTPLAFTVPAGFPQPELPRDNPLTGEGVALGKALFTDKRLSRSGTQSCASCHDPERAFSDDVPVSRGADGMIGTRNAMPLFNLAWSPAYAWDGSKPRIRDQALAAMTNPVEMHADPKQVVAALMKDAAMRRMFKTAFGSNEVTEARVGLALEQYLLTIVSADTKFDRARRGEVKLSEEESRGLKLFMTEYDPARGRRGADCFHCHGGALFSDYGYHNNGLVVTNADTGREKVTGSEWDRGKFKTPSLRNVALTAPYMHDGRFETLEEVVAHYDHGVMRTANLDPNLAKHPDAGMKLSAEDQRALVAFLKTLTDERWRGADATE